jgi:tRNA G18 (ribose-2'-O)-methylase SpoU
MQRRKYDNEELNRISIEEFKVKQKIPLIVVLDNVRSKNNIGSVFRTSDAFLVDKIYLCGITAIPPDVDIHKTALGATESVDWEYQENIISVISNLQERGYKIFAIEQTENSIKLHDFKAIEHEKIAIVFGHEVRGVQQKVVDLSDGSLEILQYGTKHSLNISVCAGIVIWEIAKELFQK